MSPKSSLQYVKFISISVISLGYILNDRPNEQIDYIKLYAGQFFIHEFFCFNVFKQIKTSQQIDAYKLMFDTIAIEALCQNFIDLKMFKQHLYCVCSEFNQYQK